MPWIKCLGEFIEASVATYLLYKHLVWDSSWLVSAHDNFVISTRWVWCEVSPSSATCIAWFLCIRNIITVTEIHTADQRHATFALSVPWPSVNFFWTWYAWQVKRVLLNHSPLPISVHMKHPFPIPNVNSQVCLRFKTRTSKSL